MICIKHRYVCQIDIHECLDCKEELEWLAVAEVMNE